MKLVLVPDFRVDLGEKNVVSRSLSPFSSLEETLGKEELSFEDDLVCRNGLPFLLLVVAEFFLFSGHF